jgi:hypothetical protein
MFSHWCRGSQSALTTAASDSGLALKASPPMVPWQRDGMPAAEVDRQSDATGGETRCLLRLTGALKRSDMWDGCRCAVTVVLVSECCDGTPCDNANLDAMKNAVFVGASRKDTRPPFASRAALFQRFLCLRNLLERSDAAQALHSTGPCDTVEAGACSSAADVSTGAASATGALASTCDEAVLDVVVDGQAIQDAEMASGAAARNDSLGLGLRQGDCVVAAAGKGVGHQRGTSGDHTWPVDRCDGAMPPVDTQPTVSVAAAVATPVPCDHCEGIWLQEYAAMKQQCSPEYCAAWAMLRRSHALAAWITKPAT